MIEAGAGYIPSGLFPGIALGATIALLILRRRQEEPEKDGPFLDNEARLRVRQFVDGQLKFTESMLGTFAQEVFMDFTNVRSARPDQAAPEAATETRNLCMYLFSEQEKTLMKKLDSTLVAEKSRFSKRMAVDLFLEYLDHYAAIIASLGALVGRRGASPRIEEHTRQWAQSHREMISEMNRLADGVLSDQTLKSRIWQLRSAEITFDYLLQK